MIPEFNEDGYLSPGIHPATLEEVAARFGQESNMKLRDRQELAVTKEKLRTLQEWYAKRVHEPAADPHVRALSLQSIKKMINQLKEEILRFEAEERQAAKNSAVQKEPTRSSA